MAENKIILLIGRSGQGKSTLANVITGKENKFKESGGSASETKKNQAEQFADKDINYLIIDTPGIGDTKMSDNEVLDIIAEAVYLARDGLSQVLFVSKGRLDQYEMATYNLLRTIIFDEHITKHTTIVRTGFTEFKDSKKCGEDIEQMTDEEMKKRKKELEKKLSDNKNEIEKLPSDSKKYKELQIEIDKLKKELSTNLAEIVESCQERIIHVDNPPITEPDEEDDEDDLKLRELNKEVRKKSRGKLLEHLSKTCQDNSYKPAKLQELSQDISEDMDKLLKSRKELEAEMTKLKTSSVGSTNSPLLKATSIKLTATKESSEILESAAEDYDGIDISIAIGKIKELEDKKAKLRKEIAEKEKIIRQKVLKHIFSNIDGINNELGGDIFLESVIGEHDWKKISPEFNDKGLVVNWLSKKFDYEQVQKWSTALGESFKPKDDAGFCAWLRDDMKLTVEKIQELDYPRDIEQLRKGYAEYLEKEVEMLDKHKKKIGKKYILTPENFQKLIQLTFSVEVAQAYQARAQAYQAEAQAYQASSQTSSQAWAQAYQASSQAWAQASSQTSSQAWAQAYQAEAQAYQASSQTSSQAWAQAYQAEAQAYQALSQALVQNNPQNLAQAYQALSQAYQARAQARAQAQAYQAEAQAYQAEAQAYQALSQALVQNNPQNLAQAYQALSQTFQTMAESGSWTKEYKIQLQVEAQHLKINLTLENIEKFFIEVKEETEEGKVEISVVVENKPKN